MTWPEAFYESVRWVCFTFLVWRGFGWYVHRND